MFTNFNRDPFMMGTQESSIDIDNNTGNIEIDVNQDQDFNNQMMGGAPMMGGMASPIIEPMKERVVNRTIEHVVPHVCPIRTKIINHHVFKHTYRPDYSCCEENVCSNVQCGSCCDF